MEAQQPYEVRKGPGRPPKAPEETTHTGNSKRMRRIKFINNEDPEMDVTFTYVGADQKSETYRLFPGLEYELPDHIVKHLNSLSYPVYQPVRDPVTGMIRHEQVGSINRFSCLPVE